MANTGFTLAGTGANNADAGNAAWSNTGNITADDGTSAGSFPKAGQTSQYLHATNFGFALPSGATIDGIVVRVDRLATANLITDHTIQLIIGGSRSGDNKADTMTTWPSSAATKDYGSASDLWGLTLAEADIESSTFGVAIRVSSTGTASAQVDAIWIDVYYTSDAVAAGRVTGSGLTESRLLRKTRLVA
jgi:hypothetical protein